MTECPVCSCREVVDTVRRECLPTMQNYVYHTREDALTAPSGELTLAVCHRCGFAWNRTFDPSNLVYDTGYDNAVPSTVMQAYYRELAEHLGTTYAVNGGLVVDIGCGNGAFLKTLCEAIPDCRGLGIDPALDRDRQDLDGRVTLVKGVFASGLIPEPPSLVVCRHVIEHIAQPVEFLRTIGEALSRFGSCPCFFEVPDLDWILESEAFWDFCYEHCNYFTERSLHRTLQEAGFEPIATTAAFGLQYRWTEAVAAPESTTALDSGEQADPVDRLLTYASREVGTISSVRRTLLGWKTGGHTIAVWGMATKGVLFSSLVDRDTSLIDFCIDINPNKQGRFVPLTGHAISAPAVLRRTSGTHLLVAVMNENYRDEIAGICRGMGLCPTLLSAHLTSGASLAPSGVEPA